MTGIIRLVLLTFMLIVTACILPTASSAQQAANLANYLRMVEPAQVFPEADRFGPLQGSPPVAPAYQGDRLLGYAFLNSDFVNAVGYSGKPIHIIVGIALDGTIAGARLVEHKEPIVLIGIPEQKITAFINGYIGRNVLRPAVRHRSRRVGGHRERRHGHRHGDGRQHHAFRRPCRSTCGGWAARSRKSPPPFRRRREPST